MPDKLNFFKKVLLVMVSTVKSANKVVENWLFVFVLFKINQKRYAVMCN